MNKAILVIDMPNSCWNCSLIVEKENGCKVCPITNCTIISRDGKFPWCPLKPMPEKLDVPDFDNAVKAKNDNALEVGMYMYDRGHSRGYNDCIRKILGT
jgi:hypothetical protein